MIFTSFFFSFTYQENLWISWRKTRGRRLSSPCRVKNSLSCGVLLRKKSPKIKKREKRRILHRFSIDLSLHIFFIVVSLSLHCSSSRRRNSAVVVKLMRSHIFREMRRERGDGGGEWVDEDYGLIWWLKEKSRDKVDIPQDTRPFRMRSQSYCLSNSEKSR